MAWGALGGARCGFKSDEVYVAEPKTIAYFNDKRVLSAITAELKELDQPRHDGFKCKQIACGERHTIAVAVTDATDNARSLILAWGSNSQGQLGVGRMPQSPRPLPVYLKLDAGVQVSRVVCGSNFSLCLTSSGSVYSWGGNEKGQLGLGDTRNRDKPEVVKALQGSFVTQVYAGWSHVAVVSVKGSAGEKAGHRDDIYVWGDNQWGQLGLGVDGLPSQYPCTPSYYLYPKPLRLGKVFKDEPVQEPALERATLALGTTHTLILLTQHNPDSGKRLRCRLFSCGTGRHCQLGPYANTQDVYSTPTLVTFGESIHPDDRNYSLDNKNREYPFIQHIAASEKASIACSNPADVDVCYVWGELPGIHFNGPSSKPTYIEALNNQSRLKTMIGSDIPISDFKILDVISARSHHMLLCRYNEKASHSRAPVVFGWGETQYGKLGLGNVAKHLEDKLISESASTDNTEERKEGVAVSLSGKQMTIITPELIRSFRNIRIRSISAKADHCALVTEDFEGYTWGYGDSGRLGLGDGTSGSGANQSANEPKKMAVFDRNARQQDRARRIKLREHQEEKNLDEEEPGTTAYQLAMKAKALRQQFTKRFRDYQGTNAKLLRENVELIHAAITQRVRESQGNVDSLTSRQRIREANLEKKILKIRSVQAMRQKEEAMRKAKEEEEEGIREEDEEEVRRIDKPDSGGCTGCGTAEGDWDDVDVESVGDVGEQDMAGFLEEKQLQQMVCS